MNRSSPSTPVSSLRIAVSPVTTYGASECEAAPAAAIELGTAGEALGERGRAAAGPQGFQHESLFYSGEDEFLQGTLPLIDEALRFGQPVLVAVAQARISLLREALAEHASFVGFVDMQALGRNPARIIPAWQQFREEHALGAPVLAIGEPIWPGRSAAELSECERHESLLNLAFAGGGPWRLLCPYDLDGLGWDVIETAQRNHPFVGACGASARNGLYRVADWPAAAFSGELPEPPPFVEEIRFSREQLGMVRHAVAGYAADALLAPERSQELVLAVSELASNSVLYGGGTGRLRVWQESGTLLCEVFDAGRIEAPLAGRIKPRPEQLSGRGLWLVNQLCDLVQIRSDHVGTAVRLHMDLTPVRLTRG
jgi:anti-sigma regulatory factor (Ser/Thr protein kinase)